MRTKNRRHLNACGSPLDEVGQLALTYPLQTLVHLCRVYFALHHDTKDRLLPRDKLSVARLPPSDQGSRNLDRYKDASLKTVPS